MNANKKKGLFKIATLAPTKHNKWYAAIEQAGISATNLLFSLLVMSLSGVSSFGIYSFTFVLCQLIAAFSSSLIIRQMVLNAAEKNFVEQRRLFASTCWVIAGVTLILIFVFVLIYLFSASYIQEQYGLLYPLGFLYAVVLIASDLFRQFLYLQTKQRVSLLLTLIGSCVATLLLITLAAIVSPLYSYQFAFVCLIIGTAVTIGLNRFCIDSFLSSYSFNITKPFDTLVLYVKKGKIASLGMFVTWLQNQSVTPLLMFMMGPTVVGYYNIARMIFMPVNVINMGLTKSALPQLRKTYMNTGRKELNSSIVLHSKTSARITFGYLAIVAVTFLVLNQLDMISDKHNFIAYLIPTSIVVILSNYRNWISQVFIATTDFTTLLKVGIAASVVTLTAMFLSGQLLQNVVLVILCAAIGELILIWRLKYKLSHTNE